MRLLTFTRGDQPEGGVLLGSQIVPLAAIGAPVASVRALLETADARALAGLARRAEESDVRVALTDVSLLAPVPDAGKIICLGLNYSDHARESGQDEPTAPLWFAKFSNSLIGSGEAIVLPPAHAEFVDYEAELAVVIGTRAQRVAEADAISHLAGAMPFNDVSARDLQLQNPLWTSGKAIDTFAPCGPALVTLDEIEDLQSLELTTTVNGELLQRGNTSEQIFGVAEVIAWLSRTITLEPGDIIATGTPAGVGGAQGRFLREGDIVEVALQGLGAVVNEVRRG